MKADADMEDLIGKALNQNFVPVLDDQKCFIGIITRKDIIKYFYQKCQTANEHSRKGAGERGVEQRKADLSAVVKMREKEGAWCRAAKLYQQYNGRLCIFLSPFDTGSFLFGKIHENSRQKHWICVIISPDSTLLQFDGASKHQSV